MSASSDKPTFIQALCLLCVFLGFQMALATAALLASMAISRRMEMNLTFIAVANGLAMIPTLWLGGVICRRPWRDLVRFGGLPWRFVPAVLLMGLGGFVLCSEIENATRYLLPMPEGVAQLFNTLFDVRSNPVGAALALILVAPLTEEALCRGWILDSLLRQWRPARAITVSALIFGAMHMNPWQFLYASALGAAFGWIYWRTRSMWLCVLAHGLNNGAAWFLAFSGVEIPGMSAGGFDGAVQFQAHWLNGAALALLVLGMGLLWTQTRSAAPPLPPPLPPQPEAGQGSTPPA